MKNTPDQEKLDGEAAWNALIEGIAAGEISILDIVKQGNAALWADGNHQGFVNATRAMHVLLSDDRIKRRFLEESMRRFEQTLKPKPGYEQRQRNDIKAKDGFRLFDKLQAMQADAYTDAPRLIPPNTTFEEALAIYSRLIAYVERLWRQGCTAYHVGQFPFAVFWSILAIEDIGKMGRLWFDLLAWDQPEVSTNTKPVARKHLRKHFLGLVPSAVINARLDRILGAKAIKRLLEDAESGQLERLRQSCLYVDVINGRTVLPDDIITDTQARFLTVMAGELWAEMLGHFPWEFEIMIEKVITYEIKIGFQADIVKQR